MSLCKMNVGSSSMDALRRRVLEIVAENDDIDALLEECLPERANYVSSDCLSFAVDGILMAMENQCILMGCSMSVLSASILGDRLKKLVSAIDQQLLLDANQRAHFFVLAGTSKRLLEQNLFNRKLFAKSVNKDTVLPLEVTWRLEKESLMSLDLFITSNLSRPSVIGGLAQNVVTLCTAKDGEREETMKLRTEIITDLLVSLLTLTYGTDLPEDVTTRGVRKVSSALLDSITKKLVQVEGVRRDVNIFEELLRRRPAVDAQVLKKYGIRQLTVILSSSAIFKVSDALSQQNVWTFHVMDKFLRSLYEQLLTVFDVSEAIELMQRLLEQNEVNWRSLLSFISVLLICEANARALFSDGVKPTSAKEPPIMEGTVPPAGPHGAAEPARTTADEYASEPHGLAESCFQCLVGPKVPFGREMALSFVENLLREAMNSLNLDKIITAMLLGRHGCLEGSHVFMSYNEWFQKMFGDANSSLCNTRKSFSFLMKFLTDIVPHEPAAYLQASADEVSLLGDGSKSIDCERTSQIETDIEKAIAMYEKNSKLPVSILEASIFKKSYFTGMFLPVLLQPRPLSSAVDMKMKFIEALHRAGKIPDIQLAEYEEKCRTLTEQLLEGTFDDDGDDDEILSIEEQLRRSLCSFRDAVLHGHLKMKEIDRQIVAVSERLFAVTKQDATGIGVASQTVVVNVEEANLSRQNVQIARVVLDVICQISCAQSCSDSSWLNSFLLMLFRHPALLQSMCVVIFHLLTDQGTKLASCHIPGLASVLVHWTMSDNFRKQFVVKSKAGNQTSFVSHVFGSLSVASSKSMRFSLEFASEFLCYIDPILKKQRENETVERMEVDEEIFCQTGTASDNRLEMSVVPSEIVHIVDYAGPRMFQQLRLLSSDREVQSYKNKTWENGSGMDPLLKSLLNVISVETTRSVLQQNEMTFREWVEREIRVCDDAMTSSDRTGYYDWIIFVRRYRHSETEESPEIGVYVEMCCATLINVMIDFQTTQNNRNRSKHDKHGQARKEKCSEISGSICQRNLFHLLQKLVLYRDRLPKTSNENQLLLWKILKERWKGLEKSYDPGMMTRLESEVSAFCEMLLLLPPQVLLSDTSTHLLNDEIIRSSINDLLWFVNEIARNYINDGLSLPPSIACHLLEVILTLPASCNQEITRFLSECPLFTSSLILNWSSVGHLRQMTTSGTTLSSVFEETERLMQTAAGIMEYKSIDTQSWTEGLAAFAQIQAGVNATVRTLCLSQEACAVLHECMIVQVAVEVLHGTQGDSPPEDLLRLYDTSPDLQCFISKPIMTKFDLSTSSPVQKILPFIRIYLFVVANEQNLLLGFSNSTLNFEFIISNYNEATKLYDSFSSEQRMLGDRSVVEILGAASARILSIINASSAEQLKAIDRSLFANSDLLLKVAYNKRLLETLDNF